MLTNRHYPSKVSDPCLYLSSGLKDYASSLDFSNTTFEETLSPYNFDLGIILAQQGYYVCLDYEFVESQVDREIYIPQSLWPFVYLAIPLIGINELSYDANNVPEVPTIFKDRTIQSTIDNYHQCYLARLGQKHDSINRYDSLMLFKHGTKLIQPYDFGGPKITYAEYSFLKDSEFYQLEHGLQLARRSSNPSYYLRSEILTLYIFGCLPEPINLQERIYKAQQSTLLPEHLYEIWYEYFVEQEDRDLDFQEARILFGKLPEIEAFLLELSYDPKSLAQRFKIVSPIKDLERYILDNIDDYLHGIETSDEELLQDLPFLPIFYSRQELERISSYPEHYTGFSILIDRSTLEGIETPIYYEDVKTTKNVIVAYHELNRTIYYTMKELRDCLVTSFLIPNTLPFGFNHPEDVSKQFSIDEIRDLIYLLELGFRRTLISPEEKISMLVLRYRLQRLTKIFYLTTDSLHQPMRELYEMSIEHHTQLVEIFTTMLHLGMYIRRWEGPGYDYPYNSEISNRPYLPDVEVTHCDYRFKELLTKLPIKEEIWELPAINVDVTGTPVRIPGRTIRDIFRSMVEDHCIRVLSQQFIITAHEYLVRALKQSPTVDYQRLFNFNYRAPEEDNSNILTFIITDSFDL